METLDALSPGLAEAPPSAARGSVFRDVPWRWSDLLIGLPLAAAPRVSSALISPEWAAAAPRWLWLPLTLVVVAFLLGFPLVIARRRGGVIPRVPNGRAFLIEAGRALLALPVVLVGLIAYLFLIMPHLTGDMGRPPTPVDALARSPNRFEVLALIVLAVMLGPVAEEVFYRGMVYNALRQWLPGIVAAILQAAAFGLSHPFDLANSIAVGLVGLALALVYEWRKTLLAPILLHALLNAVGMATVALSMAAEANAPMLGVIGDRVEGGCRVTMVVPGSSAKVAGLQVGDVIKTADGAAVSDIASLARLVWKRQAGDRLSIDFSRDGAAHHVEVVLKRRGDVDQPRR